MSSHDEEEHGQDEKLKIYIELLSPKNYFDDQYQKSKPFKNKKTKPDA